MEGLCRASSSHSIADSTPLFNANARKREAFCDFAPGLRSPRPHLSAFDSNGWKKCVSLAPSSVEGSTQPRISERLRSYRIV